MYSKYLALLLVAFQVAYSAPTLSGRSDPSGGCSPSYPGGFGISVDPIGGSRLARRTDLTQISDGQVQNTGVESVAMNTESMGTLSEINDGQVQNTAPYSGAAAPMEAASIESYSAPQYLQQITDGQVQNIAAAAAPIEATGFQTYSAPVETTEYQMYSPEYIAAAAPVAYSIPTTESTRISVSAKAYTAPTTYSYAAPAAVPATYQAASYVPASYAPANVGMLSQINDGQVQNTYQTYSAPAEVAPVEVSQVETAAAPVEELSQITDGQVQNLNVQSFAAAPVEELSQITDGQVQNLNVQSFAAPEAASYASENMLNQIPEGQVQNTAALSTQNVEAAAAPAAQNVGQLSQITDGQVQNIESGAYAAESIQAAAAPAQQSVGQLSQITDGQVQNIEPGAYAAEGIQAATAPAQQSVGTLSQINDGQVQNGPLARRQAPGNPSAGSKPLTVYLENGILKDSQGRQGYIADNYQFQFDAPPQATPYAISGFSACPDGTISLNGSNTFYQCASGDFSNIYDRAWAPHCEPIHMTIVGQHPGSAQLQ